MSDLGPAPTVGRVVQYSLTRTDVLRVTGRRQYSSGHPVEFEGNVVHTGEVYPMVIVRVWGDEPTSAVNGQVLLDGNDATWVTSVTQGDGEGHWWYPAHV